MRIIGTPPMVLLLKQLERFHAAHVVRAGERIVELTGISIM